MPSEDLAQSWSGWSIRSEGSEQPWLDPSPLDKARWRPGLGCSDQAERWPATSGRPSLSGEGHGRSRIVRLLDTASSLGHLLSSIV